MIRHLQRNIVKPRKSQANKMKIAILAFTRNGALAASKLKGQLNIEGHDVTGYCFNKYGQEGLESFHQLKPLVETLVQTEEAMVFISATGIAVRAIAPYLKSKQTDPAVLVMDEGSNFVISLLSGHIGGANELSNQVADIMGATPVITTATDVNDKLAIDVWASKRNLVIKEIGMAKEVAARILENKTVGYVCRIEGDAYSCPKGLTETAETEVGVCVSYEEENPFEKTLHLIPHELVLGVGCRKNKDPQELKEVVEHVLKEHKISRHAIVKICSIDIKKEEQALLQLSKEWKIPFETFSAEELLQLEGEFTSSTFVRSITGVDNVCERSAVLGSTKRKKQINNMIIRKQAVNGVTVAVCKIEG